MHLVTAGAFFIFGMVVNAWDDTLDLAHFTPPTGWTIGRSATAVTFTHVDQKAGTYAILGVYQSTPSRGSSEQDFSAEWDAIIRNGFSTGPTPKPVTGRTSAGLSYLVGGADATQGEVLSYVRLFVFLVSGRVVSIVLSASNTAALAARDAVINRFLGSLRLDGDAATQTSETPLSPTSAGLTCPTPASWQRVETGGRLTIERVEDLGFGQKNLFRLTFLHPVLAKGGAFRIFNTLWKQVAPQTFAEPIQPLPLRMRLKSGASLFYDGGNMRLRQGNVEVTGMVYVVIQGGLATAAVGVFTGWDASLDRELREIFDGTRITGVAGKEPPLFTRGELVGRWRYSTSALGNWVDSAGNFVGDASIAVGETLTLNADGSFRDQFAAVNSGGTMSTDTSGPFSVEDDLLVMRSRSENKTTRYRITGVGRSADGRAKFLLLGIARDDFPCLSAGSTFPRAGDLYVGVRE
jgi:hypothetical protein